MIDAPVPWSMESIVGSMEHLHLPWTMEQDNGSCTNSRINCTAIPRAVQCRRVRVAIPPFITAARIVYENGGETPRDLAERKGPCLRRSRRRTTAPYVCSDLRV